MHENFQWWINIFRRKFQTQIFFHAPFPGPDVMRIFRLANVFVMAIYSGWKVHCVYRRRRRGLVSIAVIDRLVNVEFNENFRREWAFARGPMRGVEVVDFGMCWGRKEEGIVRDLGEFSLELPRDSASRRSRNFTRISGTNFSWAARKRRPHSLWSTRKQGKERS